jgi:hypothetical protein
VVLRFNIAEGAAETGCKTCRDNSSDRLACQMKPLSFSPKTSGYGDHASAFCSFSPERPCNNLA